MTTPITTLAEYKAYLNTSDSTHDTQWQQMIDSATAALRRYAGRDTDNGFCSASRTETYDGNATESLQLREWPVSAVASVVETADDGSTQTVDSSEYRLDDNGRTGILSKIGAITGRFAAAVTWSSVGTWPRNRAIYPRDSWETSPGWSSGKSNFTITYTGGYATIPTDLKYVVWRWTDQIRAKQTSGNIKSERLGDRAYTLVDDKEWRDELDSLMATFMRGVP